MSLSIEDRRAALAAMKDEVFDLAIVGGGINGAGIARDAASRGMTVALVEAADFASGTSSRSSKLIHGGIRYLENKEFHLVFEALSERQRLFEIAPHLVHPLRFVLPLFKGGRVAPWLMGVGMSLYDALSLYDAPEMSRHLPPADVAIEYPLLQTTDLTGAFTYSDAYMDDDRLVLETLRSAASHGARIASYCKVTGAAQANGKITHFECEDRVTNERFDLRARHFVGAVGPWTDRLGVSLEPKWAPKLRPSKGVHLTFARERFPLTDAVVMAAEERIVFAIPRHEMVIVGTTDTDMTDNPGEVRADAGDVTYLLRVVDKYFPHAALTSADVIGCYAGVRPLIDDHAQTESKTSREHSIWTEPNGLTLVAGGKYTTYRLMAEQTVDHALKSFAIEDRVRFGRTHTLEPLNPMITEALLERARRDHPRWAERFGLPLAITERLAERHGLEAKQMLNRVRELGLQDPEEIWWCAEALHAVEHTMCMHLTDFFLRRTPLVLSRRDHGLPLVPAVAGVMAERLSWSDERLAAEINALHERLAWDLAATGVDGV